MMSLHVCVCVTMCVYGQSGGRKIQTVGTPWQGTPLMGMFTQIAHIFGVGCGYNEGLTPPGASRWSSKIPLDKQKEVYYYTTAGVSYSNTISPAI